MLAIQYQNKKNDLFILCDVAVWLQIHINTSKTSLNDVSKIITYICIYNIFYVLQSMIHILLLLFLVFFIFHLISDFCRRQDFCVVFFLQSINILWLKLCDLFEEKFRLAMYFFMFDDIMITKRAINMTKYSYIQYLHRHARTHTYIP